MGAVTTKMKTTYVDKTSKTVNNINPAAEDASIKEVADLLAGLQVKEVTLISRIDEKVLSEAVQDQG